MAKRRRSKLEKFFKNAQEAAAGAVDAVVGDGPKAPAAKKGFGERMGGAKSFLGDETARAIFGVVGFYGASVTNGMLKQQPIVSDYPLLSQLASVAAVYFIGTLITNNQQNKKAILLGAMINVALGIVKEYASVSAENAQLSGKLAGYEQQITQQPLYDSNVYNFNG
jgi:hypothetical protein